MLYPKVHNVKFINLNITLKKINIFPSRTCTLILLRPIQRLFTTTLNVDSNLSIKQRPKGGINNKGTLKKNRSNNYSNSKAKILHNNKVSESFGQITQDLTVFAITLQTLLDTGVNQCEKSNKVFTIPNAVKTLDVSLCIHEVVKYHNNLVIHNKLPFAFEFFNEVRSYCIQLLETPIELHKSVPTPRISTGRLDRWPTAFRSLRPLFYAVRGEFIPYYTDMCDQIIRSILNVHRICTDYSDMSLESVTSKPKEIPKELLSSFEEFVSNKFREKSIKGSVKWETALPIDESRSGPNGKMAHETRSVESYMIQNSGFNHHFKTLCQKTGNDNLYECMERSALTFFEEYEWKNSLTPKSKESILSILNKKNITLRKLTSIPDKGHKSRVIAIVDYWFQIIYKGLEQDIVRILLELYPVNCDIFDQSRGFSKLLTNIKPGFKSYDCSNWTDRFRIELQMIVMNILYGKDISNAWYHSAAKCKWKVKNSSLYVTYEAGQGMGTHGSFQIASLTSCLLMDFIYETHYKDMNTDQKIWSQVGDDMFCHDPDGKVLAVYQQLDVPINLKKSKVATEQNLVAEYISRNINRGHDVSRISAKVCHSVGLNLLNLTSLYNHVSERCKIFDWELFLKRLLLNPGKPKRLFKDHIIVNLWKILIVFNYIYKDGCLLDLSMKLDQVLRGALMLTVKEMSFLDYFVKSKDDSLILMRLAVIERDLRRIFDEIIKLDKLFQIEITDDFSNKILGYLINKSRGKPNTVFPWESVDFKKEYLSPGKRFLICKGVNSFHKFQAELLGGKRKFKQIDGMDTFDHIRFLDNLEYSIKDTLISMIPKQLSEKKTFPSDHSLRMKIKSCNHLLRYFVNDEEYETAINITFKYEMSYLKDWIEDSNSKVSKETSRQESVIALRELAAGVKQDFEYSQNMVNLETNVIECS